VTAADGMNGELLHPSIHGRGKRLELGALLGLGHVLHETGRLCFGLVELVEQGAAEFRDGLRAGLDDRGDGRFGFLELAFLHPEILLLLDQQLERLEVLQLRAEFAVVERAADVHPLLDDREGRFELGDGRGIGRALCLLLRALLVEGGDLGSVLSYLAGQELALHGDELRARTFGRLEIDYRILGVRQGSPEPGNVELGRDQVTLDVVALGEVHGGVELDEHVARLYRHPVAHVNGAYDAGLVGLNGLGAAAGDDLAGCRGDDVDLAECRPSQRQAEKGDDR
jgi:hypothetical protein